MGALRGSCKTCRHFDRGDGPDGLCRARSPQVAVYMTPVRNHLTGQTQLTPVVTANFPQVGETCWCSEWAPGLVTRLDD